MIGSVNDFQTAWLAARVWMPKQPVQWQRLPKSVVVSILGRKVPAMNMNVSLTDELSDYVKAKVSSGRYTSASEVVREALRIMEQTEEARLAFLRNAWAAGQASGDAGPADFADIKAQGRALLKAAGK
jgi:antitoxin ParD1/3/4